MSGSSEVASASISAEVPRRRRRSILERRRIVEETFAAGASVARVARAHGVNANQVFSWRRLYQRGLLGGESTGTAALVPVTISDAPPGAQLVPEPPAPPPATAVVPPGTIQLQLPKGRLRIEGAADPASLRLVLECLLG